MAETEFYIVIVHPGGDLEGYARGYVKTYLKETYLDGKKERERYAVNALGNLIETGREETMIVETDIEFAGKFSSLKEAQRIADKFLEIGWQAFVYSYSSPGS